ncbi:MAG: hypothetical protein R3D02_09015 [Hyphomicrobiales bacterium]
MSKIDQNGPTSPSNIAGETAARGFADTLKATKTRVISADKAAPVQPTRVSLAPVADTRSARTGTPTYETVDVVQFRDVLKSLKKRRKAGEGVDAARRDALIDMLSGLVSKRNVFLPEIAVVASNNSSPAGVSFNFVSAGDTVFVSERLYGAWQDGRDSGMFERALGDMLASRFGTAGQSGGESLFKPVTLIKTEQ